MRQSLTSAGKSLLDIILRMAYGLFKITKSLIIGLKPYIGHAKMCIILRVIRIVGKGFLKFLNRCIIISLVKCCHALFIMPGTSVYIFKYDHSKQKCRSDQYCCHNLGKC